jgi:hypothetical protein
MNSLTKTMAVFVLGCLSTDLRAQEVGTYDQSAQADKRFKEFRENLSSRYREANEAKVIAETFEACQNIYNDDKVKALTNSTCNAVFMQAKHPNMDSYSEFSAKALIEEYSSLTDADREVLRREGLLTVIEPQKN